MPGQPATGPLTQVTSYTHFGDGHVTMLQFITPGWNVSPGPLHAVGADTSWQLPFARQQAPAGGIEQSGPL